jgi:hypothetical protein
MTNPIYSQFICSPAILRDSSPLTGWEFSFVVPRIEVIFPCKNNERQDRVTYRIDSLDNCNLFLITRLNLLCFCLPVRACHDHSCQNNAYHKPGLVKVIDILITDLIFHNCVVHKLKSTSNYVWIFIFGPLIFVFLLKTCPEFLLSLYEISSLSWSDAFSITRRDDTICYIFYNTQPRRKSFGS